MSKKIFHLFIIGVVFPLTSLSAQKTDTVFFYNKSLQLFQQYNQIFSFDNNDRINAEKAFFDSMYSCLSIPGSVNYTFDTLKNIGRIQSENNKLTIFTWNIPQKSGFSNYYGLIQYSPKKGRELIFKLKESPGFLRNSPQMQNDIGIWSGALYYKIIETKFNGQVYYTLLGFNFNDILSNIKTIDVLTFNEQYLPVFPPNLFIYNRKPQNRIIYEYNERAQMMLEYNETLKMIVADHLSPARPSMEGQYQFYGPDFSYEGFLFEDGIWQHQTEIDVRN